MFTKFLFPGLILALTVCLAITPVWSTSVSFPKPAFLLPKAGAFLIQKTSHQIALHKIKDGELMHGITCGDFIDCITVSSDEKYLAVGCHDGSLEVWDIGTGSLLWRKSVIAGYFDCL